MTRSKSFSTGSRLNSEYGHRLGHGTSPVEAAMRADAVLEAGDLDGYDGHGVWKGVLKAVEELLREEPGDDERVN